MPMSLGVAAHTWQWPCSQVYITGHGGDGFMKFQDKEEVTSDEIGKAFALVSVAFLRTVCLILRVEFWHHHGRHT